MKVGFSSVATLATMVLAALSVSACSSSTTNGGVTGGNSTIGVDGTWDITQVGKDPVGPSEMTIKDGTITGYIANQDEGKPDATATGCTKSTDRTEFTFTFQANSFSATFTARQAWTGASCPTTTMSQWSMTGTRTAAGPDSSTALNGDWSVTPGSDSPFVVIVDGLNAKAWSSAADKTASKPPVMTIAVTNGVAMITPMDPALAFAAKKR